MLAEKRHVCAACGRSRSQQYMTTITKICKLKKTVKTKWGQEKWWCKDERDCKEKAKNYYNK